MKYTYVNYSIPVQLGYDHRPKNGSIENPERF